MAAGCSRPSGPAERAAEQDRAEGALYGLAIGDALGMPTQSLPREQIVARYGELIPGFLPGPPGHPLAAGLAAGTITDDTEQALLLAGLVTESGWPVDPGEFARRLLCWEAAARARGSLDLLGPSTRRALDDLRAGVPADQAGRSGTTNGAAMRIAPVGIATPAPAMDLLADRVVQASLPTHNTSVALAGAAAVAAAVSAGVGGGGVADAIAAGAAAARLGAARGYWVAAADVAERITWAAGLTAGLAAGRNPGPPVAPDAGPPVAPDAGPPAIPDAGPPARPPAYVTAVIDTVYRLVGTSLATQESVPAAFAVLAAFPGDPWLACRVAASAGGDCDTIAAMTGAIAGACHGAAAFPATARATVAEVNDLRLGKVAAGLLRLRREAS